MVTKTVDSKKGSKIHISVLLNESIESLDISKEDGVYVDCTLGLGGHSSEILKRIVKNGSGRLLCIDRDPASIKIADEKLSKIDPEHKFYKIVHNKFSNLEQILEENNLDYVDGILFDLGVSSPQYDDPWRGFSYRVDAPLDMRMDQTEDGLTAKDIVNTYDFKTMERMFYDIGEKFASRIAKAIVNYREKVGEIKTTQQLEDIIANALPVSIRTKRQHVAGKVFQALRIEVNQEYDEIKRGVKAACEHLKVDGRVVVITFHSEEDKIVKTILKTYTTIQGDRNNDFLLPEELPKAEFESINRKVILPTNEELENNPRARSAKLRAIRRIRFNEN